MTRVIIAGGGFSGLASAVFLARRGHRVTLVERDGPPPEGSPDDDVDAWRRAGAPQARQSHAILGRARRVLMDEAPDVVAALLARGVHEIPIVVGAGALTGEYMLLSRRLVAEAELRRIASREPGVELIVGDAVMGVEVSSGDEVPVVTAVRLASGGTIHGQLVVDAGGRRSSLPSWFADSGLPVPVDDRQDCGFFYLSQYFRVRPGCEIPVSKIPASVSLDYATVLALGADNDTFSVSVSLGVDDPYRMALREEATFAAFLREVPHSAPWVAAGDPISKVTTMSRIENRRRRLIDENGPLAGGIVVVGDAALHTNPTLGRGISMGLMHAQHLARVAHEAEDDPIGFVNRFSVWTDQHLGTWYDTQVAADAGALDRLAAGLEGRRLSPPDDPSARFAAAAMLCAIHDPVVGVAAARVAHLFAPAAEAFGDPNVSSRVAEFVATGPSLERSPDVPSRAQFEALASA